MNILIGILAGLVVALAACFAFYMYVGKCFYDEITQDHQDTLNLSIEHARESHALSIAILNRWLRANESVTLDESLQETPKRDEAPLDEEKLKNLSLEDLERKMEGERGPARLGASGGLREQRQALSRAIARKKREAERSENPGTRAQPANPVNLGDDLAEEDVEHLKAL